MTVDTQQALSFLNGSSAAYVEDLYEQYLTDTQSVSAEWRAVFAHLPQAETPILHSEVQADIQATVQRARPDVCDPGRTLEAAVVQWCQAVRFEGYRVAQTDPLSSDIKTLAVLDPEFYALHDAAQVVPAALSGQIQPHTVKDLHQRLKRTYQGPIASEIQHLRNAEKRQWLWKQLETFPDFKLSSDAQSTLLNQLIRADGMEQYLARKFVAQKRFSLEGGDALIPFLDTLLSEGATAHGLKEAVLCMAHRGRLNVMVNVFGVPMRTISKRFTGDTEASFETSGDVKYHLGCSADRMFSGHPLHLSMAYNPSHLEFVNPVLQGMVKAKQAVDYADEPTAICAITLHGDAAVCAQGVVPETLNLSRTAAHGVGGGIHIIVNNQVGHSVSRVADMTSCHAVSDIFKAFDIPVLHVNGDDPEAVIFCAQLAMAYRARFQEEIAIDLICYRRLGHNEADEPSITQPLMYHTIRKHPRLYERYAAQLSQQGVVTEAWVQQQVEAVHQHCLAGDALVDCFVGKTGAQRSKIWQQFFDTHWNEPTKTGCSVKVLKRLAAVLQKHPDGFVYQRQIKRLMEQRNTMASGAQPMNWGFAELLAYASLVEEGYHVRLVGQDVRRGTFSHRQAVLHHYETGTSYGLLSPISNSNGATFSVYDSTLSEAAVLGAEYGYASVCPNTLVLWEAQFGDFANSAQVHIDQFISSAWQKWQRLCHLVLLLPHGYEGQGPEHSSARLERYLQLSAQHNMQVCLPTTPAQMFHLLRRQMHRPFRHPLVVMTPKSLLRHPQALSTFKDLSQGGFQCVLDDSEPLKAKQIERVVLCSGKIYYELLARRAEAQLKHVALVRIEQLYPFPYADVQTILAQYTQAQTLVWCQEEPRNQGAWYSRRHCFEACMQDQQQLWYAGRDAFAAPAAGSPSLHKARQAAVIEQALGLAEIQPVQYGSVQND